MVWGLTRPPKNPENTCLEDTIGAIWVPVILSMYTPVSMLKHVRTCRVMFENMELEVINDPGPTRRRSGFRKLQGLSSPASCFLTVPSVGAMTLECSGASHLGNRRAVGVACTH